MTTKKLPGRPFEPGNKFGKGRPRIDPDIKESLTYTRTQLQAAITRYICMPLSELKLKAKDESLPVIDHLIIRIAINGIMKGDQQRMEALISRIQGNVKQIIEHVGETRPSTEVLDDMHKQLVMMIVGQSQGLITGGNS